MRKGTARSILMLGIFYFVFLGAEYYFDNMMAFVTDADGVVLAQSYVLGSSVLGFLLYAPMEKMLPAKIKRLFWSVSSAAVILMFFFIKIHSGYGHTLRAGLFLFLLGILEVVCIIWWRRLLRQKLRQKNRIWHGQ